jgi:hypothetical protein
MKMLIDALNALLVDSGGMSIVDLHLVVPESSNRIGREGVALVSNGECVRLEFEYHRRDQSSDWSTVSWKPGAHNSDRRFMIQVVDFFCTKSEHAHSVYRFFDRQARSEARLPRLEVHVLELPKLRISANETVLASAVKPLIEWLQLPA